MSHGCCILTKAFLFIASPSHADSLIDEQEQCCRIFMPFSAMPDMLRALTKLPQSIQWMGLGQTIIITV